MSYLQTANSWYLYPQAMKLLPGSKIKGACDIDVPFFFWDFQEVATHTEVAGFERRQGNLVNTLKTWRKVEELQLNGVVVRFRGSMWRAEIVTSTARVDIEAKSMFVNRSNRRNQKVTVGAGVDYTYSFGQDVTKYICQFNDFDLKFVAGLSRYTEDSHIVKYSFGLSPNPFSVKYRGRLLNGTTLALMCGPWAVLLNDDLSFDSVVALSGVLDNTLLVSKFLFTINRYIVKCITMLG